MKRFIAMLMVAMLVLTSFATVALAAGTGTVSINTVNGKAGETATLTVTVEGEFANYELVVAPQNGLKIVEGGIINTPGFQGNYKTGKVAFSCSENVSTHSFNVTFMVPADAQPGDKYPVNAVVDFVADRNLVDLDVTVYNGAVVIPDATPTPAPTNTPEPTPTATPTPTPTQKPTPTPTPTQKPTQKPTPTPTPTQKPTPTAEPECDHKWSAWKVTKEPDCVNTGIETRTCSKCGEERTRKIDALGHDFSKEWTVDSKNHWHVCSRCDVVKDHGKHIFQWITDREPTNSKDGLKHEECEICRYKRSIGTVIPHEPDLDDVPTTGDITPYFTLGAVAVLGLMTAAVLVFKRKAVK